MTVPRKVFKEDYTVDFGKIFVYILIPMSPFIGMSIGCLIEWIIKHYRH